jgi:hypothetical protein
MPGIHTVDGVISLAQVAASAKKHGEWCISTAYDRSNGLMRCGFHGVWYKGEGGTASATAGPPSDCCTDESAFLLGFVPLFSAAVDRRD